MSARRRWLHGVIFTSVLALPIAQGCGGDDASVGASGTDGGGGTGDEASTTGGDSGGNPTDGSAPQDTSTGPDGFCAAASAYGTRCHLTDSCSTAKIAACGADEAIASAGGIAAYEACASIEPCPGAGPSADGGSLKDYDACLASHYGTPSAAATTLADDFCTKCDSAQAAACKTNFYDPKSPTLRFLALNDTTIGEIDTTCAKGDAGGGNGPACTDEFQKCSRAVVDAHDPPPAACKDQ